MAHHAPINHCLFEFRLSGKKSLPPGIVLPWDPSSLSLSHSLSLDLAIWLSYTWKFKPCLLLLYISGAFFFLRSRIDINRNNTVIDLILTRLAVAEMN